MSEQSLRPLGDRRPAYEWLEDESLRVDDAATAYSILGLGEGASLRQVRRAYLERVREQHPDRHPRDSASQERAERATRLTIEAYMFLYQRDATRSVGIPDWSGYERSAYARVGARSRSALPAYPERRQMVILLLLAAIAIMSLIVIPALLIILIDALF